MGIVANEEGGVGGGRGGEQKEIVFESLLPMYPFVPGCTIPQYVFKDVEKFSERVAVVDAAQGGDGSQYTYGQVHTLVRKFAAGLKREFGIRKGDVVLVLLPNVAEYSIFFLGIISAGAIFSGSNPAFHASEIQKQVLASDAKLILTSNSLLHKVKDCCHVPIVVTGEEEGSSAAHHGDQELAAAAAAAHSVKKLFEAADGIEGDQHEEDFVSMEDEDVCAMPFSSGTTGVSKGVMITHRNIVSNLTQTLADLERISFADTAKDGDLVVLGLMPFFHIYGISGILCATMRLKGRVIVMPRFSLREFMEVLLKYGITFAPIVPPIILQLVKNPVVDEFDLSRLRLMAVLSAAAPLSTDLQMAFEAKFPGVDVQRAYGLTEHSCVTLSHCGPGHTRVHAKPGSVGFILPGTHLKFIDTDTGSSLPANTVGELCCRGTPTMKGYYKNLQATEATIDKEGWLHTGDVGYIDDDGDIFVVDRVKELIKYKGFQVPPAELEALLITHPLIADAAVVPLPDEEAGEIPAACVVLTQTDAPLSAQEIMHFIASKVATYKQVRRVEFLSSIPKSSSGKILRRLLKDQILSNVQPST
ncbi:hypothetical protein CY35_01G189200 [Sphagnum magellanicum]|nr:hypothetical protein CY35_01G189200 [Sphagnum magellanicum]